MVPPQDQHDRRLQGAQDAHPRLGGKIVAAAGGTVVLTPGGEIYTALERGTIDSCEWVGPHDDMKLGLHNAAKYYYYPGWHEPGTTAEFGFNKKAYDGLPADLKAIVDHACQSVQVVFVPGVRVQEHDRAAEAEDGVQEQGGAGQALGRHAEGPQEARRPGHQGGGSRRRTPTAKKAFASINKFEKEANDWRLISEAAYHAQVAAI